MDEILIKKNTLSRKLVWILFVLYLLVVALLCFSARLPFTVGGTATVPYIYLGKAPFIYLLFAEAADVGFYLNIVMTLPFGAFIILLRRKKFKLWQIILVGLTVGLLIEGMQCLLDNIGLVYRWVDVNDVFANAIGVVIGNYLVRVVCKIKPKKQLS